MLICSEGTRLGRTEMETFKFKTGVLVVELRAPVVPVYLNSTSEAMARSRKLPRWGKVEMHNDKPMRSPLGVSDADDDAEIEAGQVARAPGGMILFRVVCSLDV